LGVKTRQPDTLPRIIGVNHQLRDGRQPQSNTMKLTIPVHRDTPQPLDARVQLVAVADLAGTAPALEHGVHVRLRHRKIGIDDQALLDKASDVVLRRRVLLPEELDVQRQRETGLRRTGVLKRALPVEVPPMSAPRRATPERPATTRRPTAIMSPTVERFHRRPSQLNH
jgi:hypothetical protein